VDSGPCSVAGGVLTATAAGACTVSADQSGNGDYAAAAASATATVTRAGQTITFPAIASFVWRGGSATLSATASSGLAVSYSVRSGPCSVAGTTLMATGGGTCNVVADQSGDGDYDAATATADATVTRASQAIVFDALPDHSAVDPAFQLSATGGGSTSPVTFSTSSTACSVSRTTVTLVSVGTCAIEASQEADADYEAAAPVVQSFTIIIADQTIRFPEIAAFSWHGGSAELRAAATSGLAISYAVLAGPCLVSRRTVTATMAGTCTIAADQAGDARYREAPRMTMGVLVFRAAQTISFPAVEDLTVGGTATLGATASSGLPITYHLDSGPCTLDEGTLTATAPGTCVVTADQAGDASYTAARQVIASVIVGEEGDGTGCGCRTSGGGGTSSFAALLVAAVLLRRRRGR
jgi:large repetitive protein